MLIQNLLYRKNQNGLQDAGDLDGQILKDLEGLRDSLVEYRDGHLEKKVKGRSNHYGQWSEETGKKIAWMDRALELLRAAMSHAGPVPDRIDKNAWFAMRPEFREPMVLAMAMREAGKIQKYLPETVYVEKQSFYPDDWYLWSVAARRDDGQGEPWDCWTLNLTTGSLNGGHYGLGCEALRSVLAMKKGVVQCEPAACSRIARGEDHEE